MTIKRLLGSQHLSLELANNDGAKCFWPCPWLKKYGILKHIASGSTLELTTDKADEADATSACEGNGDRGVGIAK